MRVIIQKMVYLKYFIFPNGDTEFNYLMGEIPANSRIITSDDVFDYMLNIRNLNEGIHEKMEENGLYILDEPENSLSPQRQIELKFFINESVRYFGCQFIL